MADAEMKAELQGLQAGEDRKGSNASQAVDCCLETMVEQVFAVGTDQARSKFDAFCLIFFRRFETFTSLAQMPGREEGRRDSENEQEQGRSSQQLVLPTPGGTNQDAPASSLELDLHRVRGVPGESESAGRSSKQGDPKRGPSRSPGRPSTDEEEDDSVGGVVLETKKNERQPGKGPKDLERKQQRWGRWYPSNKQPGRGPENLRSTS